MMLPPETLNLRISERSHEALSIVVEGNDRLSGPDGRCWIECAHIVTKVLLCGCIRVLQAELDEVALVRHDYWRGTHAQIQKLLKKRRRRWWEVTHSIEER